MNMFKNSKQWNKTHFCIIHIGSVFRLKGTGALQSQKNDFPLGEIFFIIIIPHEYTQYAFLYTPEFSLFYFIF